ncbi:hypothetical protein TWF225_003087 [Orbilia oligospora]|nr:hypothetical protein TWF225_003087 [Orbilia oligospora]KAF3189357.1 hypothetical protein TWF225_003087 [Orbilia oligospora]KAF3244552.1 hypothetical protein TWF128_009662 [Orbilia oligospora]KAF3244553.1 hypothetical protein TWF128_009662 [Orbilia oligospora]KAF3264925.1 hypothetical protein TWF217_003078 [Orbilia oligospora]
MSSSEADPEYIWVSSNTPGGWDAEPQLPDFTNPDPTASASSSSSTGAGPSSSSTSQPTQEQTRRRRRPVLKQCRICLDQTTEDVDPELGRLISPCKCKGSARYVHEECLRAWRLHSANSQSFYKCPTCHFEYRFLRLRVAQMMASTVLVGSITALILLITVYILGFVADPIINLYINPWYAVDGGSFSFTINGFTVYGPALHNTPRSPPIPRSAVGVGIVEHMVRGLSALGLIGFGKVLIFSHHWIRYVFGGPGVRRGDGRDRMGQLSWIIIIWGVVNFLIFVWGYVRGWTKNILDKIAAGVADIGSEDDDDEEEEEGPAAEDVPKNDVKEEVKQEGAKERHVKADLFDEKEVKEEVSEDGPIRRKGFTEVPET